MRRRCVVHVILYVLLLFQLIKKRFIMNCFNGFRRIHFMKQIVAFVVSY